MNNQDSDKVVKTFLGAVCVALITAFTVSCCAVSVKLVIWCFK